MFCAEVGAGGMAVPTFIGTHDPGTTPSSHNGDGMVEVVELKHFPALLKTVNHH